MRVKRILTQVVASLLLSWSLPARPEDASAPPILESALRQIQALLDEKEKRTPAERKIDSILLQARRERHGLPMAPGVTTLRRADVGADERGNVILDVGAFEVTPALLNGLRAAGARVIRSFPAYKSIRIEAPLDRIEEIAALPAVRVVHAGEEALLQVGSVQSEGDKTH